MIADKLDYAPEKIETLQVSNDTYHNIVYKEPCLDEENIDEISELKERFPYGFIFEKCISYIEGTDLIECNTIPICETSTPFTHYKIENEWYKSEYYYSGDKKQVYYRIYNMYDGCFLDFGWNDVIINRFGHPEIRPGKNIFPLWGKGWQKY